FQRLDEIARKADADAVVDPRTRPAAGVEADQVRIAQRLAFEVAEELLARLVDVEMLAREHEPRAHPMLQRDAPLPARAVGDRTGVGIRRLDRFALRRPGAIV